MDFWVNHLKIKHFRGISHLELDFSPDTPIVFIGINGVGKSSILDCLVTLLSWYASATLCRISLGQILGCIFIDELKSYTNLPQGKEFEDTDIQSSESKLSSSIQLSSSHNTSEWSMGFSRNNWLHHLRSYIDELLVTFLDDVGFLFHNYSERSVPLFLHYSVNRVVSNISLETLEAINDIQNTGFWGYRTLDKIKDSELSSIFSKEIVLSADVGFHQFFRWFRTLEDLENEERRDNPDYRDRQLEAVRNAIANLLPGFSNLRVRRSPLRMTISKDGEDLVITQLSDGEKCLMAMVGDIARRLAIANPDLADPLQGSGIIMIDEIELHLHPEWQRRIIPALTKTFPNCQFIVTTHSPQVVSHVQPEGIFLLEKNGDEITARHPESSFGRDSNRILEDLMGVPERPAEIKSDLMELFRLIDAGNLEDAQQLRQDLGRKIGEDEPDFVRADLLIRRKDVLKNR